VITGLAIWKPVQFSGLVSLLGGFQTARVLHFAGMTVIVGFLIVHVVLALLVPKTLWAMLAGGPRLKAGAKHGEMVSLWPRHGCPKGSGRSCRRCASRRRPRLGVGDRRKAGSRHVLAPDCALLGCAVSNRRLFLENNPRERVSGLWPSLGWSRLSVGRRGGSFMAGLPSQRTDGNPDTLHSPPFMSSAPSRSPGAAYQCQGFGAALPIPAKLADTPCSSDRTPPDPAASRPA
jgi:hypothetical protein